MFQEKTINALNWIVEILNRRNIKYQISGGFAAKVYGSERALNDIDIDVPEENLPEILEEVKPYVIFDLQHINDGKWDMDLMTLNYHGQEIDIGGAYKIKVSNKDRTAWIPIPVDFSRVKKIDIEGIEVNIINPEDLIGYKKYLDGDHQLVDIKAAAKHVIIK